jgi:hypothetical protein
MSRVVPDGRHRASFMSDRPNRQYHICRIGCPQSELCTWQSPRAGRGGEPQRVEVPPRDSVQNRCNVAVLGCRLRPRSPLPRATTLRPRAACSLCSAAIFGGRQFVTLTFGEESGRPSLLAVAPAAGGGMTVAASCGRQLHAAEAICCPPDLYELLSCGRGPSERICNRLG